jgi:hypothetical protein
VIIGSCATQKITGFDQSSGVANRPHELNYAGSRPLEFHRPNQIAAPTAETTETTANHPWTTVSIVVFTKTWQLVA